MRMTRLVYSMVLGSALLAGTAASAGWVNELGRNLGLGWSDGYHAYEGCPDSRLKSQPWQRRANRGGMTEEPLVPYLTPVPAPQPPEPLPEPKTSRAPEASRSSLKISRPNY